MSFHQLFFLIQISSKPPNAELLRKVKKSSMDVSQLSFCCWGEKPQELLNVWEKGNKALCRKVMPWTPPLPLCIFGCRWPEPRLPVLLWQGKVNIDMLCNEDVLAEWYWQRRQSLVTAVCHFSLFSWEVWKAATSSLTAQVKPFPKAGFICVCLAGCWQWFASIIADLDNSSLGSGKSVHHHVQTVMLHTFFQTLLSPS